MFPRTSLSAEIPRSALLRPCGGVYLGSLIFISNAPRRGVRRACCCNFIRRPLGKVRFSNLSP